jgi:hypothetical protein
VDYEKLSSDRLGEASSSVRARVEAARERQRVRFEGTGLSCNDLYLISIRITSALSGNFSLSSNFQGKFHVIDEINRASQNIINDPARMRSRLLEDRNKSTFQCEPQVEMCLSLDLPYLTRHSSQAATDPARPATIACITSGEPSRP